MLLRRGTGCLGLGIDLVGRIEDRTVQALEEPIPLPGPLRRFPVRAEEFQGMLEHEVRPDLVDLVIEVLIPGITVLAQEEPRIDRMPGDPVSLRRQGDEGDAGPKGL